MAGRGLQIAEPPARRPNEKSPEASGEKFSQVAASEKVQFNKRVTRDTADGFELLAIRTRRKVPELLTEALKLLEAKYGKS